MKTKIALSLLSLGLGLLAYQALRAIPAAAKTGYLVGYTECSRGKELTYEDFGDRVVQMGRTQRKAEAIHKQWHADNPGKSCAEMI